MIDSCDVLIVGGGPAGLTAGIYLSRFHLRTVIVDKDDGRAKMIPVSHNHAGYPHGISGIDLLYRMREQAALYGAMHIDNEVAKLSLENAGFRAKILSHSIAAKAVLIATGVFNNRPAMAMADHDAAVAAGRLRYCPICDGYEVTDKRIGVIGSGDRGVAEALFLRSYSADITLIAPDGQHSLSHLQRLTLRDAGVALAAGPILNLSMGDAYIEIIATSGVMRFDTVYPALGSVVRSELVAALGAKTAKDGSIVFDEHQRTSIPGLYAAGDVVLGLDQISNAMGEGGVAATTIRNDLSAREPLQRSISKSV